MKKVENVNMEAVENGYKVTCYCYEKSEGSGPHDSMMGGRKEYVFSDEEGEKAFDKFKELAAMSRM